MMYVAFLTFAYFISFWSTWAAAAGVRVLYEAGNEARSGPSNRHTQEESIDVSTKSMYPATLLIWWMSDGSYHWLLIKYTSQVPRHANNKHDLKPEAPASNPRKNPQKWMLSDKDQNTLDSTMLQAPYSTPEERKPG